MPELSRFYGIIIRMFMETGERHHRPHIHVYYQDYSAIYTIDSIELIAGSLPGRQRRLTEAWIELYHDELLDNWHLMTVGKPLYRIPPLHRG
jgi:hypothetical protein